LPALVAALGLLLLAATCLLITADDVAFANSAPRPAAWIADVRISKAAERRTVVAGQRLTYTLAYTNSGPSDAMNVVVTDTLPPGAFYYDASPPCSELAPAFVRWELGSVAADDWGEIRLIVTVGSTVTQALENRVAIASTAADPAPDNNIFTTTTPVAEIADLSITKVASSELAIGGRRLTYTLTYTNTGPSDAVDVVVSDSLPAGVSFFDASLTPAQVDPLFIRWELGSVAANSQDGISLTVVLLSWVSPTLENRAQISSPTADPLWANNVSVVTTIVRPSGRVYLPLLLRSYTPATLSTSKTAEPPAVNAGDLLTYTLTLTNSGTTTARNVTLSDPIPAVARYERIVYGSPCQYEAGGARGRVTWQEPELPGGEVRTCTFVVRVLTETEGTITNTAIVTATDVLSVMLQQTTPVMVVNGGFESGDPPGGWAVTGDAVLPLPVAIGSDAFSDPADGDYQLLLGDAGYCNPPNPELAGDHHSTVTQSIYVPYIPGITARLAFSYRILTYDHLWWTNSKLGDAFEVYVGSELALRDNYDNSPGPSPGCDDLQDSGWRTPNDPWGGVAYHDVLDLSEWVGTEVEIKFDLTTRWDGYYNTWAYLDEVRVILDPVAARSAERQTRPAAR